MNYPNKFIGLRGNEVWIDDINNGDLKETSTWKVHKGMKGGSGSVSLEANKKDGFFLRHYGYHFYIAEGEGDLYENDASFTVKN